MILPAETVQVKVGATTCTPPVMLTLYDCGLSVEEKSGQETVTVGQVCPPLPWGKTTWGATIKRVETTTDKMRIFIDIAPYNLIAPNARHQRARKPH
jgi:hypothetical protein